jgi:peptidoglycan/xylan/chitin deacetylase (PgdA/CDA1 family)
VDSPVSPRATLTFDNGPTPGVTEQVLDVLASSGVKATFFAIGAALRLPAARRLAERARDEGHWLGNHTLTHSAQLGDLGDEEARAEIDGAQRELGELTHPDRLFRPFGGGGILSRHLLSAAAVDELRRGSYTCVLWNCVPRDWEDPEGWPERALESIASRESSLVVLHDTPTGAMAQLPAFLDALAHAGVELSQDFPEACVPMRRGELRASIDDLIATTNGGGS